MPQLAGAGVALRPPSVPAAAAVRSRPGRRGACGAVSAVRRSTGLRRLPAQAARGAEGPLLGNAGALPQTPSDASCRPFLCSSAHPRGTNSGVWGSAPDPRSGCPTSLNKRDRTSLNNCDRAHVRLRSPGHFSPPIATLDHLDKADDTPMAPAASVECVVTRNGHNRGTSQLCCRS